VCARGRCFFAIFAVALEMRIRLSDGKDVSLAELERLVVKHGKLFAYAPWSTSLNQRPTTILASVSADGLALFDFKTRISHRWASRKPLMVDFSELAALLKELEHE
jgi:hypothetical protein